MDKPRNLDEEYDLTVEELRAKRRAEFDCWLAQSHVRLYEAVMLSVRIIPNSHYRLKVPLPTTHPPRYPEEFSFQLVREDFHNRMVLAVSAIRTGALKITRNSNSLSESEQQIKLPDFEDWANKMKLSLPEEWRKKADPAQENKLTPQQRRQRNNALSVIRALMRAAKIHDEESLSCIAENASLSAPPDRSIISRAFSAIALIGKEQDEMSAHQRDIVRQTPSPAELIWIMALLVSKLKIKVGPRESGAKVIEGVLADDHHARGSKKANEPGIETVQSYVREIRALLLDTIGDRAS